MVDKNGDAVSSHLIQALVFRSRPDFKSKSNPAQDCHPREEQNGRKHQV
jgi:hypothetical protein